MLSIRLQTFPKKNNVMGGQFNELWVYILLFAIINNM